MSWSLRIHNGDLVLDGISYGQVTGVNKLVQDLRCAILERMGTDDLHPAFGSLIDGGRMPDGAVVESMIGTTRWNQMALLVESEIRRIASELQTRQAQRAENDKFTYGRATQTTGEILSRISFVNLVQNQDTLQVNAGIVTASGNEAILDIPVTNDAIITR